MKLYLLRHAIAGVRNPLLYPDDSERPLTGEGRKKMERAAAGLKKMSFRCDVIHTSPYVRARQTAEIVKAEFPKAKFSVLDSLAPGGAPTDIVRALENVGAEKEVLLVGHEPDFTRLTNELLLKKRNDLAVEIKKGGLIGIEFKNRPALGDGTLLFHLPPKWLRRAGRK